ncbi:MAG: tRNA epoxyqueuosine(34) reductase QueG [Blastocatellia bacterium]|nr:tRNA epoxyqueuosine(34) reductase QueG [Blastocatellia bacterium]
MEREFTLRIKEQALHLGFSKVGIAAVAELTDARARLRQWLDLGYQATMGWMERTFEKRTDPRLVFPEAKSVLVVALNYFTPHQHENGLEAGKISRYAWGDDYHDVLTEKLTLLLDWIRQEHPAANGKICVDAQPAMDKVWAVQGGIGWIGKHSNVITREFGSWVFLGELLLNLDLEPETRLVPDHCGTCTACLDACPTGAIVAPYVVDARRCISFSTIESKSETAELETAGWIFGCDICQDVCPWSRFSKTTDETRFEPRPGLVTPNLRELLAESPERFAARFAGSPIKRTKHRGLQRNIKGVLDNGSDAGLPPEKS